MALRNPENGPWLKPRSTNVSEDPRPVRRDAVPRIERKTSLQKADAFGRDFPLRFAVERVDQVRLVPVHSFAEPAGQDQPV